MENVSVRGEVMMMLENVSDDSDLMTGRTSGVDAKCTLTQQPSSGAYQMPIPVTPEMTQQHAGVDSYISLPTPPIVAQLPGKAYQRVFRDETMNIVRDNATQNRVAEVVLFIEPPLRMQLTLEVYNYLEVIVSSYNVHEKLVGGQVGDNKGKLVSFGCQPYTSVERAFYISNRLRAQADTLRECAAPDAFKLVAVREGQQFLRAFVMQQHRGMCDVYLIDYADFYTVSCADLRELPEDIARMPMCAFILYIEAKQPIMHRSAVLKVLQRGYVVAKLNSCSLFGYRGKLSVHASDESALDVSLLVDDFSRCSQRVAHSNFMAKVLNEAKVVADKRFEEWRAARSNRVPLAHNRTVLSLLLGSKWNADGCNNNEASKTQFFSDTKAYNACGKRNHSSEMRPKYTIICYACGKQGHRSTECPRNNGGRLVRRDGGTLNAGSNSQRVSQGEASDNNRRFGITGGVGGFESTDLPAVGSDTQRGRTGRGARSIFELEFDSGTSGFGRDDHGACNAFPGFDLGDSGSNSEGFKKDVEKGCDNCISNNGARVGEHGGDGFVIGDLVGNDLVDILGFEGGNTIGVLGNKNDFKSAKSSTVESAVENDAQMSHAESIIATMISKALVAMSGSTL